jgi:diaminopimelate epimerase
VPALTLTKHHGLGNDFLVLIDLEGRQEIGAETARALCDRHRGVGADGFIRVTRGRGRADLRMELRNSDGTSAETSGNGLRCLAQAAHLEGLAPKGSLVVATGAGECRVTLRPGASERRTGVAVSMGPVEVGGELEPSELPGHRARPVYLGNPHLVVLEAELAALDVAAVGTRLSRQHGGANVEFMDVDSGGAAIRTWERGAGETLACGSGSVAAAAAARAWGLAGDRLVVANPGGELAVELSEGGAVLEGPAELVARIEVCVP